MARPTEQRLAALCERLGNRFARPELLRQAPERVPPVTGRAIQRHFGDGPLPARLHVRACRIVLAGLHCKARAGQFCGPSSAEVAVLSRAIAQNEHAAVQSHRGRGRLQAARQCGIDLDRVVHRAQRLVLLEQAG